MHVSERVSLSGTDSHSIEISAECLGAVDAQISDGITAFHHEQCWLAQSGNTGAYSGEVICFQFELGDRVFLIGIHAK